MKTLSWWGQTHVHVYAFCPSAPTINSASHHYFYIISHRFCLSPLLLHYLPPYISHHPLPSTTTTHQVSQVYETVELDWLAKLAPFTTPTHLETIVIETAQSNSIQVYI